VQIVIIRHAIAEDREAFAVGGRPDAERPLTDRGAARMRRAAQGLRTILPAIDRLVSSPYGRAKQTAEIVAAEYADLVVETIDALEPGGEPADLVEWLCGLGRIEVVALVGHEPDLSALVSHLLTGRDEVSVELKKGATCLLECERPGPGECTLRWLLAPGQLRALAADHA